MSTDNAFATPPDSAIAEFVCAWCGTGVNASIHACGENTNYGICERCLQVRMDGLAERSNAAGGH